MIEACELPPTALLRRYGGAGDYTDCYAVSVQGRVTQQQYVAAFYTTWLFKLERRLLAWIVALPSFDAQADELAAGTRDRFAAWQVEDRTDDQLLLRDFRGRTCSWLMSGPAPEGGTRLHFGSAVLAVPDAGGRQRVGAGYRALLGFHKLYSRLLLGAAVTRLRRLVAK